MVVRPLANLPVADRRIKTPRPVTLPAGNHAVAGPGRQMLPVGDYSARGAGRKRRRKASALLADALIAEFHAMEEKGSDVNLAAYLLNDAWEGRFDAVAVISNDTDLVTPTRMVTAERGKPVFIVCPGRWQVAPKLREARPMCAISAVRCWKRRSFRTGCRGRRSSGLRVGELPDARLDRRQDRDGSLMNRTALSQRTTSTKLLR